MTLSGPPRLISCCCADPAGPLRKATSPFEPAEFHKESVGLSQGLGVILAAIEEAVAVALGTDQLARPVGLLHHTLERDNGSVGNRGVLLAMKDQGWWAGVFQVAKHEVTHEQYVETLSLLDNLVFFIFFTYS